MRSGAARLKRVLRPLLVLLAAGFVAWAAWKLSRQWQSSKVELQAVPALLSVLPLLLGPVIQGFAWIGLIERMNGKRVPRGPALALYLDSQLARYLPGTVGLPLVRMAGAERIGVGAASIGSSVAVEMLSWTAVGGATGFLALALAGAAAVKGALALLGRFGVPLMIGFTLLVVVFLAVDRRRYPVALRRVLGTGDGGPLVPPVLPLLQVGYFVTWVAHGYLVSRAVSAPPALAAASAGLYALATVAGFVALAAPAGVGVREAMISVGLAPAVGPAPAVAAALLSRGASLVADVGAWLIVRAVVQRRNARPG